MAVKRINFLNVPLDVLHEEDMEETVMSLLNKEGPQQIIFMTIWDVLRARRNGEFRNMVKEAAPCFKKPDTRCPLFKKRCPRKKTAVFGSYRFSKRNRFPL